MAYIHHFREEQILSSGGAQWFDLSTTAVLAKGRLAPLVEPIVLQQVGIQTLTTTALVTAPAVNIFWSSSAGTASTNWTGLATFTYTSGGQLVSGVRIKELDQIIRAGQEVIVYAKTTATQTALVAVRVRYRPYIEDLFQNTALTVSG